MENAVKYGRSGHVGDPKAFVMFKLCLAEGPFLHYTLNQAE